MCCPYLHLLSASLPLSFLPKCVVFTHFLLPSVYTYACAYTRHKGDTGIYVCYIEKYVYMYIHKYKLSSNVEVKIIPKSCYDWSSMFGV